jgi:hypothetical protein
MTIDRNGYPIEPIEPLAPVVEPGSELAPDLHTPLSERFRNGVRAAIDRSLSGHAVRDVHKSTEVEHEHLFGYREWTSQDTDPLTGEAVETAHHAFPIVPIAYRRSTELYEHGTHDSAPEINPEHPLLQTICTEIATGGFKQAVLAERQASRLVRDTADNYRGISSRIADRLVSEENKRDAYRGRMYHDLKHAVYIAIMAIPDTLPQTPHAQGNYSESMFTEDIVSWEDQLDLRNIQKLRAHIIHQQKGNEAATRTKLEAGAPIDAAGLDFANYLGVNFHALYQQLKNNGPIVVPPQVLAKINFFISYAADSMPESGLSRELAEFNDQRVDGRTAPFDRIRDAAVALIERRRELGHQLNLMQRQAGVYTAPKPDTLEPTLFNQETGDPNRSIGRFTSEEYLKALDEEIYKTVSAYLRNLPSKDGMLPEKEKEAENEERLEKQLIRRKVVNRRLETVFGEDSTPEGYSDIIIEAYLERAAKLKHIAARPKGKKRS